VVILFMSIRDFASRNVVSLIAPLSCCAVTVVWLFAFHEISAPQALTILASSVAIACASGVYRLVRVHRFPLSVAMPRDWKSRYLRFGAKSLFAQLALQGSARLDVFILNMLLGRTAVGYYSAGVSLAELGQQTTNAISTVIYPEIVKRSGADRKRVTVLTVGSAVYVIAVVSAVLAILTPWLLPFLFGAKYSPAVEAAMWLLPGMVGMTLFRMMGTVTAANGRPEDRTYAACVGLAFTVILDLLFIPTKGIVGAAQASSISYILMGITLAWLYVRAQKVDLGRFTMDLIRQPIIAAAARLRTDSSGRPIS
jgi:O-antigen/teichoic acid export membrane protein